MKYFLLIGFCAVLVGLNANVLTCVMVGAVIGLITN